MPSGFWLGKPEPDLLRKQEEHRGRRSRIQPDRIFPAALREGSPTHRTHLRFGQDRNFLIPL